jgi:hypothetical protein
MPRIPNLQQNQRISGRSAGTTDTGIERLQGEALTNLGQGISRAAQGINAFAQARAQTKNNLDYEERKLQIEIAQAESTQNALSSKELAADGSNVESLGVSEFQERSASFTEGIEDPDTIRRINTFADRAGATIGLNLGKKSEAMFAKNAAERTQQNMNEQTAMLIASPNTYDARVESFETLLRENPAIDDKHIAAGVKAFKQKGAIAAIKGHLRNKEYGLAQSNFFGKFAKLFDSDKQDELLKLIDGQKLNDMKKTIQEDTFGDKASIIEKENNIELNETELLNSFLDSENIQTREVLTDRSKKLEKLGQVGIGFSERLNRPITEQTRILSRDNESRLMARILSNENPSDIRKEVIALTGRGLTPETARTLNNMLVQQRTRESSDPAFKARLNQSRKTLNDVFAQKISGIPVTEDKVLQNNAAIQRFYDLVYTQGGDPDSSLDVVMKEFKGGIFDLPEVSRVPQKFSQFSLDGLNQAKQYIDQQVKNKKMSPKEGMDALRSLIERENILKREKTERKARIDKKRSGE